MATSAAYGLDGFDINRAASAMVAWLNVDPKDVGNLTRAALSLLRAGIAPDDAGARAAAGAYNSAANGSLMRALPTAIIRKYDDPRLAQESHILSRITHSDPRCVAACIAFNKVVSSLLASGGKPEQALSFALRTSEHSDVREIIARALKDSAALYCNEDGIGFVLLTLELGVRAVPKSKSFPDGFEGVIRQGGDAETNGTVAGALLGARFAAEAIPADWLADLREKEVLEAAFSRLLISR